MAETNSSIILPSPLFTDQRSLKALANGTVYVGKIDTDPTQPANQIPVYNRNEDGSLVQVAQPISISVGGYPVLNGIAFSPIVKGKYSIAIFDTIGVQRFYFPYVSAYQPTSASLAALAELSPSADKLPYFNGDDTAALTALTAFAREILAQTDATGVLAKLGLGNLVDALIKTNNLSDLPDKAVSRTNLGVPKGVDKQMANEWAVLSGITTVTIGDSLGISSIVRTALGTYTVNLSKPYSSINYAVMGRFIPFDSTDSLAYRGHDLNVTNQTTSSFTLSCPADYGADYRLRDASELSFAVFGAKP